MSLSYKLDKVNWTPDQATTETGTVEYTWVGSSRAARFLYFLRNTNCSISTVGYAGNLKIFTLLVSDESKAELSEGGDIKMRRG